MEVVDLDAVMPQPVIFKFAGNQIEVKPPRTGQLLRLGMLSASMVGIETKTEEETDKLVRDLTEQIWKMIPELNGSELGLNQLQMIIRAFSEMATPGTTKELEAKGITPSDPKAPQD
jgi:hypothetical protein